MSQPWKQTVAMHILLNISRNKGNETMKFGQLIQHNMIIFFFEKSYTKCHRKTILDPFLKIQN